MEYNIHYYICISVSPETNNCFYCHSIHLFIAAEGADPLSPSLPSCTTMFLQVFVEHVQ